MQCYTELVPPTAVTHAVALSFLSPSAHNLVVAKTSLLQVFDVHPDAGLELIGEYPLSGTVSALARVKLNQSQTGGEALLLAAQDAKLGLIVWDPENHRVSTISIHYYEGDNVVRPPFGLSSSEYESRLFVDPRSRCAALRFAEGQLAIVPFKQELTGDDDEEEDNDPAVSSTKIRDGKERLADDAVAQTPYRPSFVLPLTTLDPSLSTTVDIGFLFGYREPTFGILSGAMSPSSALLAERKDILTYTVYTLDLEQRASTNLITVSKLPSSLWKVVPLPKPIHGALLIGLNEIVHIDESGKPNATAVNEFARLETDFGMADQSSLGMKLEDCVVEILDLATGELLLILNDGSFATLVFQKVGKSISGLKVTRISPEKGGLIVEATPSCSARLPGDKFFVGSADGPSSIVVRHTISAAPIRKRSHAQMHDQTEEADSEEDVEMDDDDLYDAAPPTKKRATSSAAPSGTSNPEDYVFELSDQLPSLGPINSVCFGRNRDSGQDKLTLLAGSGQGRASRLALMNRDIVPKIQHQQLFESARSAWSISAQQEDEPSDFDNLLFVYDGENTKVYDTAVSKSGSIEYLRREATEFEEEGETLDMRALAVGTCIVQCRRTELRTYDSNLALNQIIPMVDEETDVEFNIIHASFCEPHVLIIRHDSSVQVLEVRGKEIEPLESVGPITEKKWLSGCIYSGKLTAGSAAVFLLDASGLMQVFNLPDLELIYTLPGLPHLSPVISADGSQRRGGTREALAELLFADIGCGPALKPYLIIRTTTDDIVLYEHFSVSKSSTTDAWHADLRFRKVLPPYVPKYNEVLTEELDFRPPPLKAIRIGDYNAVVIPGAPPNVILKEAYSLPKILDMRGSQESNKVGSTRITTLSPSHRPETGHGFMMLNANGELQLCRLRADTEYGTGWSAHQVDLGEEIRHLAFHEGRGLFVAATFRDVDFHFAEEDVRHQEQDNISIRPQVPQYTVHLVSTKSHKILHSFQMPYLDVVTSLKVMQLEVSENTHDQGLRVVVSSAAQRGEDMPAKGTVTVFDIIDVVPEPDIPESGMKLHVVAKEDTKGAVTALDVFPGGLIGTVQGQKVMIRGLKEDGTCLPVAFLDATSHIHTLKTLPQTGMWLLGDVAKGVWFGGFTEEPYKLIVLGKSRTRLEVMAAEFLPFDGLLFLLLVDAEENLHFLQYDPENPKTMGGRRLVERSVFHLGHFVTSMTLVPSSLASSPETTQLANGNADGDAAATSSRLYHVLTTAASGAIGLVTPLEEACYRRLSALQTNLTSILEHAAALNPRAYRASDAKSGYDGGTGARAVVDGGLVRRISELGANRRSDVLSRAGSDAWTLRTDLEMIGGRGLGYL